MVAIVIIINFSYPLPLPLCDGLLGSSYLFNFISKKKKEGMAIYLCLTYSFVSSFYHHHRPCHYRRHGSTVLPIHHHHHHCIIQPLFKPKLVGRETKGWKARRKEY